MTLILDGKKARDFYKSKLIDRVKALKAKRIVPRLAILQIGDNKESTIYIEQKKKFAAAIGALVDHVQFGKDSLEKDIQKKIVELNTDGRIHGIILQLPIPVHFDKLMLINSISPDKDVDGLTDENQLLLEESKPRFIPATAKGVMALLSFYKINVSRKKATVFGRSRLVGHPIAEMLKAEGATVSVIHSKTENPEEISCTADIVVVAIGNAEHIGASYIKDGAVVVDVGINTVVGDNHEKELLKRKIVGDVKYSEVETKVSAISPVPGGVGPMTVLSLFDNLVISAENFSNQ